MTAGMVMHLLGEVVLNKASLMQKLLFVCHSFRICSLSAAVLLLFSASASAQLTWDANTTVTGPQNTDGTTGTLIWNTANNNWWDGTANTSWVNSTTAIAQFGTSIPNPATANAVSIASDIILKELIFRAVTIGTIATGQQYTLNGDVPGRVLDFGTDGLILETRIIG